jgi:uncharacterized protein (TIGR03382 family)
MPQHEARDLSRVQGAVTCNPFLEVYPVAGPHNGGYDSNALVYTCHPHPGSSPDGSDFLKGDHYGNDIFAAKGTPVVAPRSGKIVKVGKIDVGGNRVTIEDNCGWQYYHAHLDVIEPGLFVGMQIKAGAKIGTVGNTGNAQFTSPHLHFSIYPDGNYNAGVDPFPYLKAVDHTACGACTPHCEGSKIVGADCGVGDCAVYGATCVDDVLGVRCVFGACPPLGKINVCLDANLIGTCNNGGIQVGDCGAFGAYCSTAVPPEAKCISAFCVDSPSQKPWAHDICFLDGQRYHCSADGGVTLNACPPGTVCSTAGGVKCIPGGCPASGTVDTCLNDNIIAKCKNGVVVEQGDCGAYGAYCSLALGAAKCVSAFCVDSPTQQPYEHDICFLDGQRYHCSSDGGITANPCPAGTICAAGPPVQCLTPCSPVPEVCDGLDQNCNGIADDGLNLGAPCQGPGGVCGGSGAYVCDGAGGVVCNAAPLVCNDGNPCTTDTCDPQAGCLASAIPGCCTADAQCDPGLSCVGNQCLKVGCAPCASQADCQGAGVCSELSNGDFCLLPCQGGACPTDAACEATPTGAFVCRPLSDKCGCTGALSVECANGRVARVDSCGDPLVILEECARGCVAAACCPPGTRAEDGGCVEDPEAEGGEGDPEEGGEGSTVDEGGGEGPDASVADAAVGQEDAASGGNDTSGEGGTPGGDEGAGADSGGGSAAVDASGQPDAANDAVLGTDTMAPGTGGGYVERGGCSAAAGSPSILALGLLIGLGLARRRRESLR